MGISEETFTDYYNDPNVSELRKSTARRMQLSQETAMLYKKLLSQVSDRTGIEKELIEELMDVVAFHETDRTMDPSLVHPESPARGLFGYEVASSDVYPTASGAGRTAINRLYHTLGGKLTTEGSSGSELTNSPELIKPYFAGPNPNEEDVDFSLFSAEEQKILFLADHLQAGSFDQIGRHLIKTQDYDRWWSTFHNQGSNPNTKVFNENWKIYNKSSKE